MLTEGLACMKDDSLWYKDAIIYQLHVRSFYDGNGDGVGDFKGLLERLSYIEALGVNCLWLLPFFASPLKDDGYDVSDYRAIHPQYGSLDDFRAFLDEAHNRGMRVIIELALNHTSDRHPWFQRARHAPRDSIERNYYVWSDSDERYSQARIIFLDTERSNWAWDPEARAYYWHRFFSHQPDLNYDNPAVLAEILGVLDFWL
jgi:maltose alpha-D-glucosyltransferase/alpha-amylase